MKEGHCYGFNLKIDGCNYSADRVEEALVGYFKQNSKQVFDCHSDREHTLRGFHKDGISIHMQTTYLKRSADLDWKKPEIESISVKLLSEVTPTQGLEGTLRELVDQFKE